MLQHLNNTVLQTIQLKTFRKCIFNLGPDACDVIITRMLYSSEIRRYNILIILQTNSIRTFRKCIFNLGPVACDVIITRMLYSSEIRRYNILIILQTNSIKNI